MTSKTDKDFLDLVAQMRAAQRKYFRTRSTSVLSEAKELERRVDAEIERRRDKQRPLF